MRKNYYLKHNKITLSKDSLKFFIILIQLVMLSNIF
jgi:hypothetical protein